MFCAISGIWNRKLEVSEMFSSGVRRVWRNNSHAGGGNVPPISLGHYRRDNMASGSVASQSYASRSVPVDQPRPPPSVHLGGLGALSCTFIGRSSGPDRLMPQNPKSLHLKPYSKPSVPLNIDGRRPDQASALRVSPSFSVFLRTSSNERTKRRSHISLQQTGTLALSLTWLTSSK